MPFWETSPSSRDIKKQDDSLTKEPSRTGIKDFNRHHAEHSDNKTTHEHSDNQKPQGKESEGDILNENIGNTSSIPHKRKPLEVPEVPEVLSPKRTVTEAEARNIHDLAAIPYIGRHERAMIDFKVQNTLNDINTKNIPRITQIIKNNSGTRMISLDIEDVLDSGGVIKLENLEIKVTSTTRSLNDSFNEMLRSIKEELTKQAMEIVSPEQGEKSTQQEDHGSPSFPRHEVDIPIRHSEEGASSPENRSSLDEDDTSSLENTSSLNRHAKKFAAKMKNLLKTTMYRSEGIFMVACSRVRNKIDIDLFSASITHNGKEIKLDTETAERIRKELVKSALQGIKPEIQKKVMSSIVSPIFKEFWEEMEADEHSEYRKKHEGTRERQSWMDQQMDRMHRFRELLTRVAEEGILSPQITDQIFNSIMVAHNKLVDEEAWSRSA